MPRILYFDCFAGASGDMLLGAFLDAGLPLDALREAVGSLAIDHYELQAHRVLRAGVSATKFVLNEMAGVGASATPADAPHEAHVHGAVSHHSHHHHHHHERHHRADRPAHQHGRGDIAGEDPALPRDHHHAHRGLAEIERLIERSSLSAAGRSRAASLFRRLAEAEAAIHDVPVERVHLHEVGALDSIVDIVGAVFALEWFGADRVMASPINVGSGTVECEHGRFPVPAPATARLLLGTPVYASGPAVELTTPTGALLVTGYATTYGPLPPMRIERVGYGAGQRDLASFPNVLRVCVGDTDEPVRTERVTVLEFEIDDMNPQLFGVLMDAVLDAGAHDVYYTPVQMKKNRPGTLVTVVAPPERRATLAEIVFRETTTLGVRYHEMSRDCLSRDEARVPTPWGEVRIKVARLGSRVVNAAPEFEDCLALARQHGVPVKDVQAAATKAWLDASPA
jgi:pyridinium-3,5-bisthiocarboxylic acid mononucleotide nickel chelatase